MVVLTSTKHIYSGFHCLPTNVNSTRFDQLIGAGSVEDPTVYGIFIGLHSREQEETKKRGEFPLRHSLPNAMGLLGLSCRPGWRYTKVIECTAAEQHKEQHKG